MLLSINFSIFIIYKTLIMKQLRKDRVGSCQVLKINNQFKVKITTLDNHHTKAISISISFWLLPVSDNLNPNDDLNKLERKMNRVLGKVIRSTEFKNELNPRFILDFDIPNNVVNVSSHCEFDLTLFFKVEDHISTKNKIIMDLIKVIIDNGFTCIEKDYILSYTKKL